MLASSCPGKARGGLCFVGEKPGDEGALFCKGGFWVTGLDDGRRIVFDAVRGDGCLTGDMADGPVAGRSGSGGPPFV